MFKIVSKSTEVWIHAGSLRGYFLPTFQKAKHREIFKTLFGFKIKTIHSMLYCSHFEGTLWEFYRLHPADINWVNKWIEVKKKK